MTAINYVRSLAGGVEGAAHGCRSQARSRVAQPGPVGEVVRWCETVIAFACLCRCGIETAVAFAGEKWAFLVQLLGVEVMPVSAVPCWGRAVLLLVSMSPCFCVLCAKFFALLGLGVGASAKKFALHAQNGRKTQFFGLLGEFFRGSAAGGAVLGELFRGGPQEAPCWVGFFARPGAAPRSCRRRGAVHVGGGGGFAALDASCRRVAGVSRF